MGCKGKFGTPPCFARFYNKGGSVFGHSRVTVGPYEPDLKTVRIAEVSHRFVRSLVARLLHLVSKIDRTNLPSCVMTFQHFHDPDPPGFEGIHDIFSKIAKVLRDPPRTSPSTGASSTVEK